MAKTIIINDVRIKEFSMIRGANTFRICYELVDSLNGGWGEQNIVLAISDFSQDERAQLQNLFTMITNHIKQRSNI